MLPARQIFSLHNRVTSMRSLTFGTRVVPFVLVAVVTLGTGAIRRGTTDEEEIRRTVQYYFDGGAELAKAFHPQGQMLFVRDGQYTAIPIADYIARAQSAPKDPAASEVQKRIVSIDVTGSAATAKLEQRRPGMIVTDYMSLLKVDGRWVIVNKIFDRQVTAPPAK